MGNWKIENVGVTKYVYLFHVFEFFFAFEFHQSFIVLAFLAALFDFA